MILTRNYHKTAICILDKNITGTEFLNLIANWHGMDIFSDEFVEFLEKEGFGIVVLL